MRIRGFSSKGMVVAVCMSERSGEQKKPVAAVLLRKSHGIIGDAQAGEGSRQVSLLARESIRKLQEKGLVLSAGDFDENIITEGINLPLLALGTQLAIGEVRLEVTQIGKECTTPCIIHYRAGECIMPKEGVFAQVVQGGKVRPGDMIRVMKAGEV